MRACIQRVTRASVTVEGEVTGRIDGGYVILLGISPHDSEREIELLSSKIANLRVLEDENGVMNRSALDVLPEDPSKTGMLVISQFTLYADVRKGRRPSWTDAAPPEIAEPLVDRFCGALRAYGLDVQTGVFGAKMAIELVNDGPVTIWLDSDELQKPRRG
jgi:D-aminoacyl-tRNA deacylase